MSAYPWSRRPDDLPLNVEEVCQALAECNGIIVSAAARLKVGTLVLRKYVERSAKARAVQEEMGKCRIEKTIIKLDEALEAEDTRRVDWAIRFVLNSENAKAYGHGSRGDAHDPAITHVTIQDGRWLDGTRLGPPQITPPTIDLHPSITQPTPTKAAE